MPLLLSSFLISFCCLRITYKNIWLVISYKAMVTPSYHHEDTFVDTIEKALMVRLLIVYHKYIFEAYIVLP